MTGYVEASDASEVKQCLDEHGYAVCRGWLNGGLVENASSFLDSEAERLGWGKRSRRTSGLQTSEEAWSNLDFEAFHLQFARMWTHENIQNIAHAPELLALMSNLLDTKQVFVHPLKVLRLRLPTAMSQVRVGLHQDFPEFQGKDQLTCWIPLSAMRPETGALPLIAGSHRAGIRPMRLVDGTHSGWESCIDEGAATHVGEVEPGDVIVFTSTTVHGRAVQHDDRLRYSLDCRYQRSTDLICEATTLRLAGNAYGWDDLIEMFGDEPGYQHLHKYWAELDLTLIPFDESFEVWREQAALTAGRRGEPEAKRALEIVAVQSPRPQRQALAQALLSQKYGTT